MHTNIFTIWLLALVAIIGGSYFLMANRGGGMMAGGEHRESTAVASYEIYPGDVVEKIKNKENIVLLDVRTPEEYADFHLAGARLLPVQELSAQSLASIGLGETAKDAEIIVYCRSGARGKTAYDIMHSLGYTNVKSIAGGMIHWEEDQYPFTEAGAYTGTSMMPDMGMGALSGTGPRISLDRTFDDLGVVPQYGGVVRKTFTIQNIGTEALTIGDIMTSCSCTSATVSTTTLKPKERATLTVVFNPNFHEEPLGVFKRTVFIPTNDPATPEAEVVIQVDIAEGI